jgi:peptidoglycan/xylan/chitin deacetylase (PgdA/CDA1 family)
MPLFRTPHFFRWIFPKRMWGFSCPEKKVYLTFDDGPTPVASEWVLDFLRDENAPATFFCLGENVKNHPELFERMKAEGHAVGNHSYQHEHGFKASKKDYFTSIEIADELIQSKLFRPPYGRMPISYDRSLKKYTIVMWSWMAYDFDDQVTIEQILQSAKSIRGGDILIFHDNQKSLDRLKIILPQVVEMLKDKGFSFEVIT